MCDPVTAAGLALSAGGTFLQQREQNKNISRANKAKEGAYTAHTIRQKKFQDEAGAAFNENINNQGADNFAERQDEEAGRIKQAFGEIRTTPDYQQGIVASAPKNVVIARQRASEEAGAETDRDVDNFARLNSFQGATFNQGLDRNKFTRAFGNIADTATRDSRLLPLEISAAATNSQKAPSAFPAIVSAAGKGLSLYGAANPGSSFFNKTVEGPLPVSGVGPGVPVEQQGLFSKAFGGF
jgi:hypothetical protein